MGSKQKKIEDIKIGLIHGLITDKDCANIIYELININNFDDAKKLYNIMISYKPDADQKYHFLMNIIKERQKYNSYDEKLKERYNQIIEKGRKALALKEYELAYDYFLAGKHIFKLPIFDYYIGKSLHKAKRYKAAVPYFKRYNKVGGEKISKSLLFTLGSSRGYTENFVKIYNKIVEADEIIDKDFDFNAKVKPIEGCIIIDKGKVDKNNEEINLEEKLNTVKNLLKSHNLKSANKLLKTLKGNSLEEKRLIKQLNIDKKIYINSYNR